MWYDKRLCIKRVVISANYILFFIFIFLLKLLIFLYYRDQVVNANGHPTSTLTVQGLTVDKTHTFTASHVQGGKTLWSSFKFWTIQSQTG